MDSCRYHSLDCIFQASVSDNVFRQTPLQVGRIIGGYFNDRLPAVLSEVKAGQLVGQKFNELAARDAARLYVILTIRKRDMLRANFLAFAIGAKDIGDRWLDARKIHNGS